MTLFTIPLDPIPQTFAISLGGIDYNMTVKWNDSADAGWQMDLSDVNTGESIVAGIPLITGRNLLDGLEYLGIEGEFWVYTEGGGDAVPTLENLGSDGNLYFRTDDLDGQ